MKSSGIQFVFWMVLLVYEVIRLRSMSLIHQDDLVIWGWGQHSTGDAGDANLCLPFGVSNWVHQDDLVRTCGAGRGGAA